MQTILDDHPDSVRYDLTRGATVNDNAALRLRCGEGTVGPAQFLMEFHRFCLKPVSLGLAAPILRTRQTDLRRNIKNKRHFWYGRPDRYALKAADQALIDIPQNPLIDAC